MKVFGPLLRCSGRPPGHSSKVCELSITSGGNATRPFSHREILEVTVLIARTSCLREMAKMQNRENYVQKM